jgi:hypothetical protein
MSEAALIMASSLPQVFTQLSSAYSESQAIRAQASYQSQQLGFNAKMAEFDARRAEYAGRFESDQVEQQAKRVIGAQRAALAAQGVDIGVGSAVDLEMDTADIAAADAEMIRNNAFLQATGYRIDAVNYRGQSEMTRIQGKYASRQTLIGGGLQALGTMTSSMMMARNAGGSSQGSGYGYATPGQGGYGKSTPAGVYNTGKVSLLPRR